MKYYKKIQTDRIPNVIQYYKEDNFGNLQFLDHCEKWKTSTHSNIEELKYAISVMKWKLIEITKEEFQCDLMVNELKR